MSINYSFVVRATNPTDKNSEKKVYATVQSKATLSLRDIAAHISEHNSVFSEGTTLGLLVDAVRCMTENLQLGNRIDMWDLGTFYVTLSSEGADSSKDFNESLIKEVNLRWMTSEKMHEALQKVGFERIATRDLQTAALKTMSENADTAIGTTSSGGDDTDDPGDGGGGGDITGGDDQTE